ncbi:hypothetical protein L484_026022 [Morus notabilis]|uniref:Pentatricopeptide repeat-containing protein n=1 Tax=Morus notabilis TaxID=981085 RepID=W9RIA2_9ROSA|nr:pentatricopeptide repeat-containing protein At3g13150 [Morus notabilis]EXB75240.1 hypothetical protein L484_026022 [Morus notabilis]
MSSVNSRLRAIFSKSVPAKTKVKPKSNVAAKSSDISAFPEETKLLKLVNKFKKSCEDPKFRCKHSIYRRTVRRLANAKKFSMIEDVLESQKKYDSIRVEGFANRLISLYGESGMFEHAHKLFDEMPELNCERTVKSFNVLLKAALDAKKFDKVVEIFKEFPLRVSVEPDLFSYNIVIHSFCEMGSFDDALSMFHEMEGNGMEPSLITYNTLLNALYRNGKFLEGERLWTMMEGENIAPDVRTYNARLRGIFIGDAGLEADEVISEMERKGIKPDLVSYNALIKGFCDGGNLKEAMKWYGELQKNNCRPDLVTFATLIPACCNAGDLVVAYELCLKAIDRRVLLKAAVFKNVVDGLARKVKYDEASELVKLVNSASHLNYKLE